MLLECGRQTAEFTTPEFGGASGAAGRTTNRQEDIAEQSIGKPWESGGTLT